MSYKHVLYPAIGAVGGGALGSGLGAAITKSPSKARTEKGKKKRRETRLNVMAGLGLMGAATGFGAGEIAAEVARYRALKKATDSFRSGFGQDFYSRVDQDIRDAFEEARRRTRQTQERTRQTRERARQAREASERARQARERARQARSGAGYSGRSSYSGGTGGRSPGASSAVITPESAWGSLGGEGEAPKTKREFQRAFRKKMMQVHPDITGGDGEAAKSLNNAWKRIQESDFFSKLASAETPLDFFFVELMEAIHDL